MTEYIKRAIAICIADYAADEHPYDKNPKKPETFSDYNQGWHAACDYIRELLENAEKANAAPVRHGHWIEDGSYQICSECGEEHSWDEYRASYCEDCGARMDWQTVERNGIDERDLETNN